MRVFSRLCLLVIAIAGWFVFPAFAAMQPDTVTSVIDPSTGLRGYIGASSAVVVQGYRNVSDGGGGSFAKLSGTCDIHTSASWSSSSTTLTITGSTAGIVIGMTFPVGSPLAGNSILKLTTDLSHPNNFTLASIPTTMGINAPLTINGDNGGTVIKDGNGNCWQRVTSTHSVLEWGAWCDGGNHNDTNAIQNAEAIAEQVGDYQGNAGTTSNGQAGTVSFPAGLTCSADTITIQGPVSWISSGTKQGWIQQNGSVNGTLVNVAGGTANAFIAVAAGYRGSSDPQPTYAPAQVVFNNIGIVGANTNGTTYNNMGVAVENPPVLPYDATWVYFDNVSITNFPNHLLYSYNLNGVFRGSNLVLWNSGQSSPQIGGQPPSCMVLDTTNNPYRFYNLVTAKCFNGLTLNAVDGPAFYGVTSFSNAGYGVSVTGTPGASGRTGASVIFYNAESNNNDYSNFFLDPVGGTQTVYCFWCRSQRTSGQTYVNQADVEIGPDATGQVFSA